MRRARRGSLSSAWVVPKPLQVTHPQLPMHSDWAWHPDLAPDEMFDILAVWGGSADLTPNIALHHDGSEGALRVVPESRGVSLWHDGFNGSYISLSLSLDSAACRNLRDTSHLIDVFVDIDAPRVPQVYLRLNAASADAQKSDVVGIASTWEGKRAFQPWLFGIEGVKKLWLDIIFERPEPSGMYLRDVLIARRPASGF